MDTAFIIREESSAVHPPDFADEIQRTFEKLALTRQELTDSSKETDVWIEASLTKLQYQFEERRRMEDGDFSFSPVWTNDTVSEMRKLYKFLTETRDARGKDAWSEEEDFKKQQLVLAAVNRMQLDYLHRRVTDLQIFFVKVDERDVASYCVRTANETFTLLQFYVDILICLNIAKKGDGWFNLGAHLYERESPASLKFLSQLCKKATNTLRLFLWDVVEERGNVWTREDKGTLKGLFLEVLDLGRVTDVPEYTEGEYSETSVEESSEEERGRQEKRGRREKRRLRKERGSLEQQAEKAEEEEHGKEEENGSVEENRSVEENKSVEENRSVEEKDTTT